MMSLLLDIPEEDEDLTIIDNIDDADWEELWDSIDKILDDDLGEACDG